MRKHGSIKLVLGCLATLFYLPTGTLAASAPESLLEEWEQSHLEREIARHQLNLEYAKLSMLSSHQKIYKKKILNQISHWKKIENAKAIRFRKANINVRKHTITSERLIEYLKAAHTRGPNSELHKRHLTKLSLSIGAGSLEPQKIYRSLSETVVSSREIATLQSESKPLNIILVTSHKPYSSENSTEKKIIKSLKEYAVQSGHKLQTIEINPHNYNAENGHLIRNLFLEWEDQTTPTLIVSASGGQETVIDFFDNFPSYAHNARVYGWIDFNYNFKDRRNRGLRSIASYSKENPATQKLLNSQINRLEAEGNIMLPIRTIFPVLLLRKNNSPRAEHSKESAIQNAEYFEDKFQDAQTLVQDSIRLLEIKRLNQN